MNVSDKILTSLRRKAVPICDDCLTISASLNRRQQANQICRSLQSTGILLREHSFCRDCHQTKLVNSLIIFELAPLEAQPIPQLIPQIVSVSHSSTPRVYSEWYWEGNVVASLVAFLEREGWKMESMANTAIRERGIDIQARKEERLLLIEVKGYPSSEYQDLSRRNEIKPTNPTTQAPHWYAEAILKAMILQQEMPTAEIAIGLPENNRYLTLLGKTHLALSQLSIRVYLVNENGTVREYVHKDEKLGTSLAGF